MKSSSLKLVPIMIAAMLTVSASVVYAGSLTPPSGTPSATSYTFDDIYSKLITNSNATAANHSLSTTTSPAASFHTLTQIYGAIPTINAAKLLSDTTYLGITGSISIKSGDASASASATSTNKILLTPAVGYYDGVATVSTTSTAFTASNIANGVNIFGIIGSLLQALGNASVGDVFSGKTFSNSTNSNITGTLNLACNTSTFDGSANLVSDAYDGSGNGANRWCMKDTGTAVAGDILSGKKAWVSGLEVSGSATAGANVTGINGTLAITIPDGLYSGSKTATANDTNLAQGNIKSGVNIFGITGNVIQALGNAGAGDVLAGKTFSSSTASNVSGTIAVKSGDASATASATSTNKLLLTPAIGYYDGSTATVSTTSVNFTASNIANGVTLFGITGSLTSGGTGNAGTADVFTGVTFSSSTASNQTGTLTLACSTSTFDGVSNMVPNAYDGAGNGTNRWCMINSGTATASQIATNTIAWVNGVALTGTLDPYSPQKFETIDDYVDAGATTTPDIEFTGEESTWTAVSGSPFAGYNTLNYLGGTNLKSGVVKQDTRTGLWWSDVMAVGSTASTTGNIFTLTGSADVGDGTRPTGGAAIGFCDALNTANYAGHNDWYLPTQKQMMQAYIDGAMNNLPNPAFEFWTSTQGNGGTGNVHTETLYNGTGNVVTKAGNNKNVICVRP